MTFKQLGLVEPILKALSDKGYENPTPIQAQSIPILLKNKDLLGCAQTGTGKTAAFAIPIVQHIYNDSINDRGPKKIKALVVTPTRELAIQIADNFVEYSKYTKISTTVIFGGVKQGKQTARLKRGVDVLVATPGRLLDLISQGFISLKDVKYCVLDEADHMLDMGFIHDVKRIIKLLPEQRQSLLFSATMPKDIVEISTKMLGEFERVTIKPQQATAERVEQAVYMVTKKDKNALLQHILNEKGKVSTLVFSRTKHGANKIVKILNKTGFRAEAIHGNKSQGARQKALKDFKDGRINILVATDIAARGIDVDDLALVINFDLPNIPETYVHRIGRTGRAAASGIALSFSNGEERAYLRDIEKLIGQKVDVITEHPYVDDSPEPIGKAKKAKNQRGRGQRPSNNQRSNNQPNNKKSNRPNKKRRPNNRSNKPDEKPEANQQGKSEHKPDRNRKPKTNTTKSTDQVHKKESANNGGNKSKSRNNQKPKSNKNRPNKSSRVGSKTNSDYTGRYRPKGTMWELE